MGRFINYIRDTKGELKHVSWPTRRQSIAFTIIVIIISILSAAYLGIFDYLFSQILQKFIL
ncbi:MAG: preprotein translocase subunit SecE [bacterium]